MTIPSIDAVFTNASSGGNNNLTTLDVASVVTNGLPLLAWVTLNDNGADAPVFSSVVLDPGGGNETAFSVVASSAVQWDVSTTRFRGEWWVLSPTSPSGTFTVRCTGNQGTHGYTMTILRLANADTANLLGTPVTGTGSDDVPTVTVTPGSIDSRVVAGVAQRNLKTYTPGADDAGHSALQCDGVSSRDHSGWVGSTPAATTTAFTVSVTANSTDTWGIVGLAVKGVASEGGAIGPLLAGHLIDHSILHGRLLR